VNKEAKTRVFRSPQRSIENLWLGPAIVIGTAAILATGTIAVGVGEIALPADIGAAGTRGQSCPRSGKIFAAHDGSDILQY
jgi:hypothetical protein